MQTPMNRYRPLLLVLFAMLFSTCLDEIKLEVPERGLGSIAIRGKLIHGNPSQVEVSVAKVSDFVQFDSPSPIENALVQLIDQDGNILSLGLEGPGIYRASVLKDNPALSIERGKSYQVRVTLVNGVVLESSLEPLLSVPAIEAIQKEAITREFVNDLGAIESSLYMQFLVDTPLESPDGTEPRFLKWEFECTYRFIEADISDVIRFDRPLSCYFTDPLSLNKIQVFDGPGADGLMLKNHLVLEEPLDHRFYRGYYLTVYQQSLSEGAYNYWSKVGELINRNGNFLESFPAKLKGNFTNINDPNQEVFGFFYATAQDTMRVFVDPEEASFPFQYCPPSVLRVEFENLEDQCKDCLSRERSSLEKPDYWIQ